MSTSLPLRICLLVFVWVGTPTSNLSAQEVGPGLPPAVGRGVGSTYAAAITQLEAGQWSAAAAVLEDVVLLEPSAAAFHQLAVAATGVDDLSLALWAVHSSLALGGVTHTEALRAQLEAGVPAEQRALSASGFTRVVRWTSQTLGGRGTALVALLTAWAGTGLLVMRRRKHLGAAVLIGIASVAAFIALRQNQLAHPGIAIAQEATAVFSAPSSSSGKVADLAPGAAFAIGESLSGMTRVDLPTGEGGWIPTESFRPVDPLGVMLR